MQGLPHVKLLQIVSYFNIWDDSQEAEDNQHVDQADHLPQRKDIMRGGVPVVLMGQGISQGILTQIRYSHSKVILTLQLLLV